MPRIKGPKVNGVAQELETMGKNELRGWIAKAIRNGEINVVRGAVLLMEINGWRARGQKKTRKRPAETSDSRLEDMVRSIELSEIQPKVGN